jgi:hypothetical protein
MVAALEVTLEMQHTLDISSRRNGEDLLGSEEAKRERGRG